MRKDKAYISLSIDLVRSIDQTRIGIDDCSQLGRSESQAGVNGPGCAMHQCATSTWSLRIIQ